MNNKQKFDSLALEELKGSEGQSKLKIIQELEEKHNSDNLKKFFVHYMREEFGEEFQPNGIGAHLVRIFDESPFKAYTQQTFNRWLRGEEKINRPAAHQICMLFGLGLKHSGILFREYIDTEFIRYNEWQEVLYRYCIEKKYDGDKVCELYERCLNEIELDGDETITDDESHSVTILTAVIKEAFHLQRFIDDEQFLKFMKQQKDNFHRVRSTRRRQMMEIFKLINKDALADKLADAFHWEDIGGVDDDFADADNDEWSINRAYFKDYLDKIENREENFSRELLILCMLISGMNSWREVNDMLTLEYIDFSELNVNSTFDACVIEACEYSKRSTDSAFKRFCDNTYFLKYKRIKTFASNY